jgi:hypothetical protein
MFVHFFGTQDTSQKLRFYLRSGEALILDNWRLLHSRQPYQGQSARKMWRRLEDRSDRPRALLNCDEFCFDYNLGIKRVAIENLSMEVSGKINDILFGIFQQAMFDQRV